MCMPCPEKYQTIYIQEKEVNSVKTFLKVSGLIVRCQQRSRERCKQQSKDCLVNVEGNYWGDVRQEHTNKVERQSVQEDYKTSHGVWCRMLGS